MNKLNQLSLCLLCTCIYFPCLQLVKKIAFGVTNHTSRLIIRNGNIRPRLYCCPCCLIAGEFKTEWFPMSQTICLYWQLCLGEIKTGRNCLQVEKNENNPAYSIYSEWKFIIRLIFGSETLFKALLLNIEKLVNCFQLVRIEIGFWLILFLKKKR